jgi:hypothetical protein
MARIVHFNALPLEVRATLSDSFNGSGKPAPILSSPQSLGWAIGGWGTLAACGLATVIFLFQWDLGRTYGDLLHQGWPFLLVYAGAFACVGLGIGMIAKAAFTARALPWPPGVYLYATGVIDARTAALGIHPMADVLSINATHHHTNGVYTHTEIAFSFPGVAHSFTVRGQEAAEWTLQHLRTSSKAVANAARDGDIGPIVDHDPLFQARISDGWDALPAAAPIPREGLGASDLPMPVARAPLALAVLFAAVGVPVWVVRDLISDQSAWDYAAAEDTEDGWQSYVWNGGRHVDDAKQMAADAAFRHAETVGAVRRFLREYPEATQVPGAQAKLHALFGASRADFLTKAADDPEAVAFMGALLSWLETHDEPVAVRFLPPTTTALDLVDQILAAEYGTDSTYIPIAPHFAEGVVSSRQTQIVERLKTGFATVFPNDVLPLALGDALTSIDDLPADRPVIAVAYDVGPSAQVFVDDEAHKTYAGINVHFEVHMVAPGAAGPFEFGLDVEPPDHFSVTTTTWGDLPSMGPSDGEVYDQMAYNAYEALVDRTHDAFFAHGEDPAQALGYEEGYVPEEQE